MMKEAVKLTVDGSKVPMNPFVQSFIAKVVYGMVTSLHGVKTCRKIKLELNGVPKDAEKR
jgi:hypothetical protein